MADWLAQLQRRTSNSDGSSSSALEPTFRVNNPRNRGRRVTSGGSVIRAPRRNVLSGDLSLSADESGLDYPVLQDLHANLRGAQIEDCFIIIDPAERRLVELVRRLDDTDVDPDTELPDFKELLTKNTETVNRMAEDEWMLR